MRGGRLSQALTARDKALEYLLDAVDVPLPEGLITAQLEEHFADGHGDDDHRAEIEEQARRSLTAQLVLDEVVKATEVQVTQEELTQYLIERAQQSGMSPQDFADQMVRGGNVNAVVADVARGKALALMVEKATVVDESGNAVDLARLQEDGTLADAVGEADDGEQPTAGMEIADVVEAAEVDDTAAGAGGAASDSSDDEPDADAPTANTDKVEE